jgi:hypothetical protein
MRPLFLFSKKSQRRRFTGFILASIGLLFFLLPAVAVGLFRFHGTDFAPTLSIKRGTTIFTFAIFVITLALLVASHAAEIRAELQRRRYIGALKNTGKALIASIVVAGLWYSFLAGPFGYLLHQHSSPSQATVLTSIDYSRAIGRVSCRYQAVLEGDTYFWQRRLCGISREQHFTLETGGVIELTGTVSEYGILVSHYDQPRRR